jgi:hypothetical protein
MDAYDFTLEPAELAALSLASSNGPLHYPYNFLEDWFGIDLWKRLQGQCRDMGDHNPIKAGSNGYLVRFSHPSSVIKT